MSHLYCDRIFPHFGATQEKIMREWYTQPHRCYHNIDHIESMFKLAAEDYPYLGSLSIFEGNYYHNVNLLQAIAYHDLVYYPGSAHNETLSAELYFALTTHVDGDDNTCLLTAYNSNVHFAICKTAAYLDPELRKNNPTWVDDFLDYDLAGLATDAYVENGDNIWFEAASVMLDMETDVHKFIQNRIKFMNGLLALPAIYSNRHPQWEDAARKNIAKSIEGAIQPGYAQELLEILRKSVVKA